MVGSTLRLLAFMLAFTSGRATTRNELRSRIEGVRPSVVAPQHPRKKAACELSGSRAAFRYQVQRVPK